MLRRGRVVELCSFVKVFVCRLSIAGENEGKFVRIGNVCASSAEIQGCKIPATKFLTVSGDFFSKELIKIL